MNGGKQPVIEHRDVRVSHSENLALLLAELRATILISTYQTGHLVVVASRRSKLVLTFHQFERAMGIAVRKDCIAVCTGKEVWFARNVPDIAAKLEPRGQFDACFLARTSHFTGDIRAHECAWVGNEFWVVNTLFSCVSALHPYYSFAPRWQPPYITALAPGDRCHLNGMAIVNGQARYATALGETDTEQGWRAVMATGGCLLEIPSGRVVARNLSVPHSPREVDGKLYLLQSGRGSLDLVNPSSGRLDNVAEVPGVTRGLEIHGGYAFVGHSKARPSLRGVPIVERRDELICGMTIIDLKTGQQAGHLEFRSGVEEIFDVRVLPGITFPYVSGPLAERDTGHPLWTVPPSA